jgi:hypothetical protein
MHKEMDDCSHSFCSATPSCPRRALPVIRQNTQRNPSTQNQHMCPVAIFLIKLNLDIIRLCQPPPKVGPRTNPDSLPAIAAQSGDTRKSHLPKKSSTTLDKNVPHLHRSTTTYNFAFIKPHQNRLHTTQVQRTKKLTYTTRPQSWQRSLHSLWGLLLHSSKLLPDTSFFAIFVGKIDRQDSPKTIQLPVTKVSHALKLLLSGKKHSQVKRLYTSEVYSVVGVTPLQTLVCQTPVAKTLASGLSTRGDMGRPHLPILKEYVTIGSCVGCVPAKPAAKRVRRRACT